MSVDNITEEDAKDIKLTIDNIKQKLEEQDKLSKEYLDLLQRSQADFRNYKQRIEKETQDIVFIEVAKIFVEVLQFRETLVNAINKEKDQKTKESINHLLKNYDIILKRQGLEKIDVLDTDFDYNTSDCLLKQEVQDQNQNNKVIAIIEDGFTFRNRLVKPAKVIVGLYNKKENGDEK